MEICLNLDEHQKDERCHVFLVFRLSSSWFLSKQDTCLVIGEHRTGIKCAFVFFFFPLLPCFIRSSTQHEKQAVSPTISLTSVLMYRLLWITRCQTCKSVQGCKCARSYYASASLGPRCLVYFFTWKPKNWSTPEREKESERENIYWNNREGVYEKKAMGNGWPSYSGKPCAVAASTRIFFLSTTAFYGDDWRNTVHWTRTDLGK